MKPDLGLKLLRDGTGPDVSLNFYNVPFQTIDFIARHSYSAMLEHEHLSANYAVSFDFGDDVFAFLIANLPSELRDTFHKSLVGKSFPFSADLPAVVEASSLVCTLGTLQRGAHDSFVPLTIVGVA